MYENKPKAASDSNGSNSTNGGQSLALPQRIHLDEASERQVDVLKTQTHADTERGEKSIQMDNLIARVKSLERKLSRNDLDLLPDKLMRKSPASNDTKHLVGNIYDLMSADPGNKENEGNTDLSLLQKSRCDSLMKSSKNGAFGVTSPPKEITLTSVSSSRAAAIKGAGGRSGLKKKLDKARGVNKSVTFVEGS